VLDYNAAYTTDACEYCANLTASSLRLTRGGSIHDGKNSFRSAVRVPVPPAERTQLNGIRCAGIRGQ
jgi:formylglycine-generating enzyme required for sulfatase activity